MLISDGLLKLWRNNILQYSLFLNLWNSFINRLVIFKFNLYSRIISGYIKILKYRRANACINNYKCFLSHIILRELLRVFINRNTIMSFIFSLKNTYVYIRNIPIIHNIVHKQRKTTLSIPVKKIRRESKIQISTQFY